VPCVRFLDGVVAVVEALAVPLAVMRLDLLDGAAEAAEVLAVPLKAFVSQGCGGGSLTMPFVVFWCAVPQTTSLIGWRRQRR
jgi:hypothetical protein